MSQEKERIRQIQENIRHGDLSQESLEDLPDFIPETDKEKKFHEFMSMPKAWRKARGLGTEKEICQYLHITQRDARRWSGKSKAKETPQKIKREILQKLYDLAVKGNVQAAREYAELQGWRDKDKNVDKFELSGDDYVRIGREVVEQLRKEYQEDGGSCPVCGFNKTFSEEPRLDTESE